MFSISIFHEGSGVDSYFEITLKFNSCTTNFNIFVSGTDAKNIRYLELDGNEVIYYYGCCSYFSYTKNNFSFGNKQRDSYLKCSCRLLDVTNLITSETYASLINLLTKWKNEIDEHMSSKYSTDTKNCLICNTDSFIYQRDNKWICENNHNTYPCLRCNKVSDVDEHWTDGRIVKIKPSYHFLINGKCHNCEEN